jgi:hypothetical protein
MVLTCSIYLALLMCCLIEIEFQVSTLYGDLNPSVSLENGWCPVRAFVTYRKILQSFPVFLTAIIAQWVLAFLSSLPHLLSKSMAYIPSEYNCQVSLKNTGSHFLTLLRMFFIPMSIITRCNYSQTNYISVSSFNRPMPTSYFAISLLCCM